MENKITEFQISPIAVGNVIEEKEIIKVNKEYIGGLKHLSKFSHAIIIYRNKGNSKDCEYTSIFNTSLAQKVVSLMEVNEQTGIIYTDILDFNNNLEIYDIKPYFTNEDRVKDCFMPKLNIHIKEDFSMIDSGLILLGQIQKKKGEFYLKIIHRIPECFERIKGYSHIKIFWWFHKFDKSNYRRIVEGQPPYENAPRTGVFASRSPVRPNPIALTTAKVLDLDENQGIIKVSKLDCFDQTPIIGVSPYNPVYDRVQNCHLPKWLNHWPEWLDDRTIDTSESSINLKKSAIENIQKFLEHENVQQESNNVFKEQEDMLTNIQDGIVIKGARQNNLKDIDVNIPYGKITVITGVSGSGKSSLAFDTIFAESQQRFMESMSLSERSQFKQLEKPKFDQITGLPPAISISQKNISRNPRSTVGTMTDSYNFLRSLFATIGVRHCPECGNAVLALTDEEIVETLKRCIPETKLDIRAYGSEELIQQFIVPDIRSQELKVYSIELRNSVIKALEFGKGAINVTINETETLTFQNTQMCYNCDYVFFKLTTSDFSFNNPESMCPVCKGLGRIMKIDSDTIVSKPNLSILDGASSFWGNLRAFRKSPNANWMKGEVLALADDMGINLEMPWSQLPDDFKQYALFGTGTKEVTLIYSNKNGRKGEITRPVEGAYNIIKRFFETSTGDTVNHISENYMTSKTCDCCNGERLGKESRMVTIAGTRFPDTTKMTIEELKQWIEALPKKLDKSELNLVLPILKELHKRLNNYIQIGLSYLNLDRSAPTLSGGEHQRLRLVTQLSSGITNILYILDEPSTGLHPKDHNRLLDIIRKLKKLGNTVIVVEHDADTMLASDNIIDIGPSSGEYGGYIVSQGSPESIMQDCNSETGKYLSGRMKIRVDKRLENNKENSWIYLTCVNGNNLKNINIAFPTSSITCITGVSGSGKSTLVSQGIYPAIKESLNGEKNKYKEYKDISGADVFEKIVRITQNPIGRTSRSNPATYTGIMDEVRKLFSQTSEAKQKKFKANRFSFNSKEGQCKACNGEGRKSLNIQFMSDVWTECHICKGKRYNSETLGIKYKDKNISDVLEMSIETALEFFKDNNKLQSILKILVEVGLGYLRLGQSSLTLSGGEAQRIKLATEMNLSDTGKTVYLLDEPTTGLHFSDIQNLLIMLRNITKNGNTVILIEHNLDMIRNADWIIDLGREGGPNGGNVIAQGTPMEISLVEESYTGQALKSLFEIDEW